MPLLQSVDLSPMVKPVVILLKKKEGGREMDYINKQFCLAFFKTLLSNSAMSVKLGSFQI